LWSFLSQVEWAEVVAEKIKKLLGHFVPDPPSSSKKQLKRTEGTEISES
jgi:hypothetical protein